MTRPARLSCIALMVWLSGCTSVMPTMAPEPEAEVATDTVPVALQSQFDQAMLAAQGQRWELALAGMRSVWEQQPELSGAALNAAVLHLKMEQPQQARQWFERAVQANPDNARAHNEFAAYLRQEGEFEQALTHYKAALAAAPDYPEAHYNLAILYDLYLGNKSAAIEHFQRYQSLQEAPDRRVTAWIADLQRQQASVGGAP